MRGFATWDQPLDPKVDANEQAASNKPEQTVVEHRCNDACKPTSCWQAMRPGLNNVQAFREQR